jgi:HD-like signal output (HDOD) protein
VDIVLFSSEGWTDDGARVLRELPAQAVPPRAVLVVANGHSDAATGLEEEGINAVVEEPLSSAGLDLVIDEQLEIAEAIALSDAESQARSKLGEKSVVTYSSLPAVGSQSSRPELRDAVVAMANELRAGKVRLQGLSSAAVELQRLLSDPRASLTEIARRVEQDANLAASVIRAANAAAFRGRTPTSDVQDAGRRIGVRRLSELVQTEIMRGLYRNGTTGWAPLLESMRRNTLSTAWACRTLAERLGDPSPGSVYSMGLFANVGEILVVDLHRRLRLPPPDGPLAAGGLAADMEAQHAHLGALLLRSWQLPAALQAVAFAHHEPTIYPVGTPMNRHCWLVAAAHSAVVDAGATYKVEHHEPEILAMCAGALGVTEDVLRAVGRSALEWWEGTRSPAKTATAPEPASKPPDGADAANQNESGKSADGEVRTNESTSAHPTDAPDGGTEAN